MSDNTLVFVPAYRCAPQIPRVLEKFTTAPLSGRFAEILVLDNQSPDATIEAARKSARGLSLGNVSIARNRENYGLGGSHKAAFTYAIERNYSHVVVVHGDDQGNVQDLLPVLKRKDHLNHDCCLGARFHPEARLEGYSRIRTGGNLVFNALFSLAARRRLYDLGSGLNMYAVPALRDRYWNRFPDNLMFNYCMVLAHVYRRDRMTFFPISWREDDQVSNVNLGKQGVLTLQLLAHFVLSPEGFFAGEFREKPHPEYRFDMVEQCL